jgi:hypothetical protein
VRRAICSALDHCHRAHLIYQRTSRLYFCYVTTTQASAPGLLQMLSLRVENCTFAKFLGKCTFDILQLIGQTSRMRVCRSNAGSQPRPRRIVLLYIRQSESSTAETTSSAFGVPAPQPGCLYQNLESSRRSSFHHIHHFWFAQHDDMYFRRHVARFVVCPNDDSARPCGKWPFDSLVRCQPVHVASSKAPQEKGADVTRKRLGTVQRSHH